MNFGVIDIAPLTVPSIKARYELVESYAQLYMRDQDNTTIDDFVSQAVRDTRDPEIRQLLRTRIATLRRNSRRSRYGTQRY